MSYVCHLLVTLSLYAMLAVAADLVIGCGGLMALSAGAFYGLGAYLYAIFAVTLAWHPLLALGASVFGSAVAGIAFAAFVLRFRGETFIVATMAVQMAVFGVFYNWTDVTGGAYGFPDIPRPGLCGFVFESPLAFALLALACAAAFVAFRYRLRGTRFLLTLRALREDEGAAATLGIAPRRVFTAALVIASAMAAVPGGLFAAYVAYVDPTGFTIGESVFVLSILVVGGCGNVKGPLLGAAFMVLLPEALRFLGFPDATVGALREIVYGLLLIVFMYFRPKGFAGDCAVR